MSGNRLVPPSGWPRGGPRSSLKFHRKSTKNLQFSNWFASSSPDLCVLLVYVYVLYCDRGLWGHRHNSEPCFPLPLPSIPISQQIDWGKPIPPPCLITEGKMKRSWRKPYLLNGYLERATALQCNLSSLSSQPAGLQLSKEEDGAGKQRESWNLTNKGLSPLNPPHLKGERHGLKTLPPHTRSESVWSVLDNFINPGKCNQMESNSELPLPSGRQRETFILARRARNLPFVIKSTQINCVCYPWSGTVRNK